MKLVLLALCVAAASAALRGQAPEDRPPTITDTNRNPGSSPDTGATYNKARITGAGQNYVHGTTHAKFVDDANNHPEAKNTANSPPFPGGLSKEAMTEDAMKTIPPQEPPALVKHNVPCCYKMSTARADFIADNNNMPRPGATDLHGVVTPKLASAAKDSKDPGALSSTLLEVAACRTCSDKEMVADKMRFKKH